MANINMAKLALYKEMRMELEARKRGLLNELNIIEDIAARKASINERIAEIDTELSKYNSDIASLEAEAAKQPKSAKE